MSNAAIEISVADALVVPAPLSRAQTKKVQPKNLAVILSVCGKALKTFGDERPINAVTILILLQHIITAVNKVKSLSTLERKELALSAIQWIIEQQKHLSDEEKDTLDLLAETIFPQAVELLSPAECFLFSCFSCTKTTDKTEDKVEEKAEVKEDVKPEVKEDVKPEVKEDVKPEVKEEKVEVKKEKVEVKEESKKEEKVEVKEEAKKEEVKDVKTEVKA